MERAGGINHTAPRVVDRGWGKGEGVGGGETAPIHAHIRLPYHSDNESGPTTHSQLSYKHQADSLKGALLNYMFAYFFI